jgi:hypothetical protein
MSYDYTLFKAPGPGSMDSWTSATPLEPLGTLDELKDRLAALYPGTTWSAGGEAWFGRWMSGDSGIEFQITPDRDGALRHLAVRRTPRSEVERVCRHLGVVAVDNQTVELIRV